MGGAGRIQGPVQGSRGGSRGRVHRRGQGWVWGWDQGWVHGWVHGYRAGTGAGLGVGLRAGLGVGPRVGLGGGVTPLDPGYTPGYVHVVLKKENTKADWIGLLRSTLNAALQFTDRTNNPARTVRYGCSLSSVCGDYGDSRGDLSPHTKCIKNLLQLITGVQRHCCTQAQDALPTPTLHCGPRCTGPGCTAFAPECTLALWTWGQDALLPVMHFVVGAL